MCDERLMYNITKVLWSYFSSKLRDFVTHNHNIMILSNFQYSTPKQGDYDSFYSIWKCIFFCIYSSTVNSRFTDFLAQKIVWLYYIFCSQRIGLMIYGFLFGYVLTMEFQLLWNTHLFRIWIKVFFASLQNFSFQLT